MTKNIEIDGKQCTFKSSAAIPRIYRIKFKRDIFHDLNNIKKAYDKQKKKDDKMSNLSPEVLILFENIAYLMHKHGDKSQPDNIDDWLDQFEMFDIYKVLPDLLELWNLENEQKSTLKKKTVK